jgi:hypothetical protein
MRGAFPELADSGYLEVADNVYRSGESFIGHAAAAVWDRGRGPELTYTDAVLQALRGDDGTIDGLVYFALDVTDQVLAARPTGGAEIPEADQRNDDSAR